MRISLCSTASFGLGRQAATGIAEALRCGSRGVITLFATVDRSKGAKGVTAFLGEPTSPGFAIGKKEKKMAVFSLAF